MKKFVTLFLLTAAASIVVAERHVPVEICHKGRTIVVDDSAVPAHEAHGDQVGACAEIGDS